MATKRKKMSEEQKERQRVSNRQIMAKKRAAEKERSTCYREDQEILSQEGL